MGTFRCETEVKGQREDDKVYEYAEEVLKGPSFD